jgi:hypothetical protein
MECRGGESYAERVEEAAEKRETGERMKSYKHGELHVWGEEHGAGDFSKRIILDVREDFERGGVKRRSSSEGESNKADREGKRRAAVLLSGTRAR